MRELDEFGELTEETGRTIIDIGGDATRRTSWINLSDTFIDEERRHLPGLIASRQRVALAGVRL